jgi:hypothetical protein
MRVNYDAKTDTLTVILRDVPLAESDEEKPGVILVEEPGRVTLHTA